MSLLHPEKRRGEVAIYGNIAAAIVAEGIGPFFALDVLPSLPQARLEVQRQAVR